MVVHIPTSIPIFHYMVVHIPISIPIFHYMVVHIPISIPIFLEFLLLVLGKHMPTTKLLLQ